MKECPTAQIFSVTMRWATSWAVILIDSGAVLAVGSDGAVAPAALSQLLAAWTPNAAGYGGN